MCQEDQACQQGCRCPEGRCSLQARRGSSGGRQRGALGRGHQLWRAAPRRVPGAGRRLHAPWALRVHGCPGPQLGPGEPAPGGLQQLHVPGGAALLHRPALPASCPLRLEPLVSLESLQPLVRARRAAEPLPVWGRASLSHLAPPGPPAAWTRPPGLPGFLDPVPAGDFVPPGDLALAVVPGHPCLSLATSTPALGFPTGGGRRDEGPGTISHLLRPGAPPRSSTSGSWAPECREEQSQSQPCPQSPCPPLCLQGTRPRSLGDSWLQDGCQQW